MRLSLRLLGGFHAEVDGRPLFPAGQPDLIKVWGYLLLFNQRLVSRDGLAFTLWPDLSEADARARLRRSLHRLRQVLPPALVNQPWLLEENRALRWNPQADFWLDVNEFCHAADSDDREQLAASLALYRGDLLPEISDAWLEPERARLRQQYRDKLNCLIELHLAARDYPSAQAVAAQLLNADPHSETALRRLMSLRYLCGNRVGALQLPQEFQVRLGERPGLLSAETLALRDAIIQGDEIPLPWGPPAAVAETQPPARRFPKPRLRLLWVLVLIIAAVVFYTAWFQRLFSPIQTLSVSGPQAVRSTWIVSDYPQGLASPYTTAKWYFVDLQDGRGPVDLRVPFHEYPLARLNLAGNTVADALLYFDLSQLPQGSRVEGAQLSLYLESDPAWAEADRFAPVTITGYRLLRAWDPSTVTFTFPWVEPGLRPGEDYDPVPLDRQTILSPGFARFDLQAAFPAWQRGDNFGLILMVTESSGGASPYWLVTAHHPDISRQPQLTLLYR
jgi:DNA-binding SARP family transcriptional activator